LAYVADRDHLEEARGCRAGAFLVPVGVGGLPAPTLQCRDPRRALAAALALFYPSGPPPPGSDGSAHGPSGPRVDPTPAVGPLAVIESGAVIGPRARVGALVYVGAGAEVGEDSVLFPHVVIYSGCRIGRRVIVHAGVVIGADGFGFIPGAEGHVKI